MADTRRYSVWRSLWNRVKAVNERAVSLLATILFALIYFCIVPWFSFFVKKPIKMQRTNWHRWPFRADSLEDLRKQY